MRYERKMNRNELIRCLEKAGFHFERRGGNNTVEVIERHNEVPEKTDKENFEEKWNSEIKAFDSLKKMKNAYPVFIQKDGEDYLVYVPDIDAYTSGKSMYKTIYMARELLGTMSLETQLPFSSDAEKVEKKAIEKADVDDIRWSDGILKYVNIDIDDYCRKLNQKAVKKNCTIPF